MHQDKIRYRAVKILLEAGRLEFFKEIFDHIPYSVVASDLEISANQLKSYIENPGSMKVGVILDLSELLDCDPFLLHELVRKSLGI